MGLDIRLPIGLLFSLGGVLLVGYGLTSSKEIYAAHSLGININLIWGAVLVVFGALMLAGALRGRKAAAADAQKK